MSKDNLTRAEKIAKRQAEKVRIEAFRSNLEASELQNFPGPNEPDEIKPGDKG